MAVPPVPHPLVTVEGIKPPSVSQWMWSICSACAWFLRLSTGTTRCPVSGWLRNFPPPGDFQYCLPQKSGFSPRTCSSSCTLRRGKWENKLGVWLVFCNLVFLGELYISSYIILEFLANTKLRWDQFETLLGPPGHQMCIFFLSGKTRLPTQGESHPQIGVLYDLLGSALWKGLRISMLSEVGVSLPAEVLTWVSFMAIVFFSSHIQSESFLWVSLRSCGADVQQPAFFWK